MKRLVFIAVLFATVFVCAGCTDETTGTGTSISNASTLFADTKTLAETGDAEAQFSLGNMYAEGKVVPNDFTEAAKWFRKASDQGDAGALYALGVIHSGGLGVPVDLAEGYVWFCLAAKAGFEAAVKDCESLEGEFQPEELVAANSRIDELFEEIQLRE